MAWVLGQFLVEVRFYEQTPSEGGDGSIDVAVDDGQLLVIEALEVASERLILSMVKPVLIVRRLLNFPDACELCDIEID